MAPSAPYQVIVFTARAIQGLLLGSEMQKVPVHGSVPVLVYRQGDSTRSAPTDNPAKGPIMKFSTTFRTTTTWMAQHVARKMNEASREISMRMERLSHTADEQFADGFTDLIAGIEASLRDEEAAMEACNYPALRSYREQHARALGALHHAQPRVEGGDIGLGREALALLRAWLLQRSTRDLALASAARAPARRRR